MAKSSIYIDTHTHIYDKAFSGEEKSIIEKALSAGVGMLLQPDIDRSERQAMKDVYKLRPDVIRNMSGLYPGSVKENWESEVAEVEDYAHSEEVVAIGEVGLDYHYSADNADLQQKAFRAQLEIADKLNLPVNIHLREATEDFFKVLEECKGLSLRGNLHAFSGSAETFRRACKYGDWMIGVGGVVTFKNAGLAEAVKQIPLDRILLETDAPYLTPTPFRGKRNDSSFIPLIAAKIAELKGVSIDEVAEVTTENAVRMFNLKKFSI